MQNSHSQFYSKAKFYDIAFSFKNVAEENKTLLDIFQKLNSKKPRSFLDIAAGPATNAIEMSLKGIKSFAIDYSNEMVMYGKEQAKAVGADVTYLKADMRNFELPEPVDMAAIFMDSTSYLITNEDVINHFQAVARSLTKNGIYVLEMSHPRDVFSVGKSASTEWTEKQNDIEVTVQWGCEDDVFDPILQKTYVTAKLKYKTPFEEGEIVDKSEQRCFTFNEIDALVRAAGCFEMVEVIGSFKPDVTFSNEKASWRMIPILKRK